MTSADEAPAIDTVVLAFAADPVARWSWPDSHQYLTSVLSFIRAFGGNAFTHGGAYCTDGYAGAALWLPPGVPPDEEMLGEIVQRTVSASTRGDVFAVFEQAAKYHPAQPHWYLPCIGVDPVHQGKGHGDALMTYALQHCDRDQVPGVPGVHQPPKCFPLPAPRLRGSRHDSGWLIATAHPDAAATPLRAAFGYLLRQPGRRPQNEVSR